MKFIPFSLFFILLAFNSNAQQKRADLIINNVNIIDVVNNKIIPNCYIAIQKNKIVEISSVSLNKAYASNETIDATRKYIMPSLWDMHVHFGGDPSKSHIRCGCLRQDLTSCATEQILHRCINGLAESIEISWEIRYET